MNLGILYLVLLNYNILPYFLQNFNEMKYCLEAFSIPSLVPILLSLLKETIIISWLRTGLKFQRCHGFVM